MSDLKQYASAALFLFPLVEDGDADFVTDYTPAAGDAKLWTDTQISTNLTAFILGFDSMSQLPNIGDLIEENGAGTAEAVIVATVIVSGTVIGTDAAGFFFVNLVSGEAWSNNDQIDINGGTANIATADSTTYDLAATAGLIASLGNGRFAAALTPTEMGCKQGSIHIIDSATKAIEDQAIHFETYGNAAALHAVNFNDSVRMGLTALPNAAADAAGGLVVSDAGGLDMDNRMAAAASITRMDLFYGTDASYGAAYSGPRGPGIYLNDAAANTNTANGTDGTFKTPVSTIAAAKTLADSMSIDRIYLVNNSSITLAATMQDYEFIGIGEIEANVVNLGSQDVDNSFFCNMNIQGTQGGSGRISACECALADPGAGATTLHICAHFCGIVDEIEVDTSADNVFNQCYSLVAGTAAPIIIATGAAGTISVRHFSGGIEFKSLSASHNVSLETDGQVIFNADCNVNATVVLRGNMTITDNTAGMNSLTTDAVYDKRSDIAAILADTAVIGTAGAGLTNVPWNSSWDAEAQSEAADALVAMFTDAATLVNLMWNEAMVETTGAPAITGSMREFMQWWAALSRNEIHQTATTTTLRNDADNADLSTSTVSDDGTTFERQEFST